ncbi:MAG TPA: LPS export ABC transporter periplasmic protein LptC [Rhizomicrobium sp.]|jgi:lipopolysaccharide export system protein LptC
MAQQSADLSRPVRKAQSRHAARHVDWTAEVRTTMNDARRYTRFVSIMKRVLLVAAAALVLAVLAYTLQPRDASHYQMTFERMGRIANDLTMVKPRLTGTDSDGSPFVVTADTAVQDRHNIHRAQLSNVQADLTAKDGAWYNVNAPNGYLDSDGQKLWLRGKIAMYSDTGYELHTDAAFVDLAPSCDPKTGKPLSGRPAKKGKAPARCARTTISGNREVKGQGPLGTVRADRFHLEKATKHIYLDGHVRMVLYPSHNNAKPAPQKSKKA